jgi:hypothetical protein
LGPFQLFETRVAVVPPGIQLRFVGVDTCSLFVSVAINGQAFILPATNGPLAMFQVGGDFFPRIKAVFGRRLRGVVT